VAREKQREVAATAERHAYLHPEVGQDLLREPGAIRRAFARIHCALGRRSS
jgi:hypothetical protein